MRDLFPSEKPLLWVIFFSKSLLNGWNHVKKKKYISKDSSYQIYFTEIDSLICNLKELTQPAKRSKSNGQFPHTLWSLVFVMTALVWADEALVYWMASSLKILPPLLNSKA